MIVGTTHLTGETSKRKRPRGGFAGLCVYVVGKEGLSGTSDRSDPALAQCPVSSGPNQPWDAVAAGIVRDRMK